MLLAIDIGNTNITFGVFKGGKIVKRFDIHTHNFSFKILKRNLINKSIDDAIICSVVPDSTKIVVPCLKKMLGKSPYIIGKDIQVPIKNLYRNPKQVGQDRLVNAYAAIMLYKAPVIMVDFGTAVTFDVVSKDKQYLGGMILPGLKISLEVLNQRTALLPKIKLNKPEELIGRDTKNSMLSGIVWGFAAMADELIKKLKRKLGKNAKAIGTGGDINLIAEFSTQLNKVDRNLTLKGLNLIYRNFLDSAAHCRRIKENFH
jgi:type III pantothenate kinase